MILPTDSKVRKGIPIGTGVVDYFPLALAEVARCSKAGNDQHNPGKSLHWDKSKSTDHADCLLRHFIDRGKKDSDGIRESARMAWRALALLQTEMENETANTTQSDPESAQGIKATHPCLLRFQFSNQLVSTYNISDPYQAYLAYATIKN